MSVPFSVLMQRQNFFCTFAVFVKEWWYVIVVWRSANSLHFSIKIAVCYPVCIRISTTYSVVYSLFFPGQSFDVMGDPRWSSISTGHLMQDHINRCFAKGFEFIPKHVDWGTMVICTEKCFSKLVYMVIDGFKICFCHKVIFLGFDLLWDSIEQNVTRTVSWSLTPRITLQDSTNDGWFVRRMSRMLLLLVGLWTICK